MNHEREKQYIVYLVIIFVVIAGIISINYYKKEKKTSDFINALESGSPMSRVTLLLKEDPGLVNARAKDGSTALYHAVAPDNIELVKLLVSKGADVNAKNKNKDGEIPLEKAIVKDQNILIFLVSKGADVNAKDNYGFTPLHIASYYRKQKSIDFLISKGAGVNITSLDGLTPLHCIITSSSEKQPNLSDETMRCIELLISKGANVNIKDKMGDTPLARALRFHRTDIADLLRKHGVKE